MAAVRIEKPRTLPQAVQALHILLPASQLDVIRRSAPDDLVRFHFNLGAYIRNLWVHDGSPLNVRARAAGARVGDGDELSRLIIEALWHDLNGAPFDVTQSSHFHLLLDAEQNATQLAAVLLTDD